ncbi:Lipoprotein signal peptidase [hydrothermal vent metagenome]|uniref:Lipoprotein signal peptidase n=1 Tax=hydrothermal vent metagenome TaxID=652676 RepID=A0A3B1AAS8_9ZZZZ
MLKWLWVTGLVVILDQATKQISDATLVLCEFYPCTSVAVMPMFDFTLMYNRGAAFSFLNDAGGWQRWAFSAIAIIVSGFIFMWIRKLQPSEKWVAIALALILGGALGNVSDRLIFGYVIDFIHWYVEIDGIKHYWPAFNIADSAISIGAVMLIIDMIRGFKNSPAESKSNI